MNMIDNRKKENEKMKERYLLAAGRVREIGRGDGDMLSGALDAYFRRVSQFLMRCCELYDQIENHWLIQASLEELQEENAAYYQDIQPGHYEKSYANPACAVRELGEEYGRILSFLYTEMRSLRRYAFMQDRVKFTILLELFLEVYHMFSSESVSYRQIRSTVYDFLYDNAEEFVGWRVRELVDPELSFATDIVMESDPNDSRFLYMYGEYISENEIQMAEFLNTLPETEIAQIARTFTDGYKLGFQLKHVNLSEKQTVNIRYPIGFERIIRTAVQQFGEVGLKPVMFPAACNTLNKRQNMRIGYVSANPNPQYDYDHRFDDAIYFDKRMQDRKISCMRKAYEEVADLAEGFAGPACFETFGEEPFEPVSKPEAYRLSERQQNLIREYQARANALISEFINQAERSFTIIAFPVPEIGPRFPEIFEEIRKVNTLDNAMYRDIQQKIIQQLDQAEYVHILGRNANMTNIMVALADLENPEKETKFENCLADVNIPVGEVFTTPKLEGTNGLLHVSEVYLNGVRFKELKLTFEDGKITEYSCGNYEDPEEGKKFIEENLLHNHSTLPMGELAIGTNTTAYVMASKYNIKGLLPILIAEKMGPHMAIGDTCYSYAEDIRVFNPDGKEIIAKDNSCSIMRKEDPKKAYFNCHTDITIPYEEIGSVNAVTAEHVEIPIILDGRFVLDGTLELNRPFVEDEAFQDVKEDLVSRLGETEAARGMQAETMES